MQKAEVAHVTSYLEKNILALHSTVHYAAATQALFDSQCHLVGWIRSVTIL